MLDRDYKNKADASLEERICFDNIGEEYALLSALADIPLKTYLSLFNEDLKFESFKTMQFEMQRLTSEILQYAHDTYADYQPDEDEDPENPAGLWQFTRSYDVDECDVKNLFYNIFPNRYQDSGLAADPVSANHTAAKVLVQELLDFVGFEKSDEERDEEFSDFSATKYVSNSETDRHISIELKDKYDESAKYFLTASFSSPENDDSGSVYIHVRQNSNALFPPSATFAGRGVGYDSPNKLVDKTMFFMIASEFEAKSGIHFDYQELLEDGLITKLAAKVLAAAQEKAMRAEKVTSLQYQVLFTDALNYELMQAAYPSYYPEDKRLIDSAEAPLAGDMFYHLDSGELISLSAADNFVGAYPKDSAEQIGKKIDRKHLSGAFYSPEADVLRLVRFDSKMDFTVVRLPNTAENIEKPAPQSDKDKSMI